MRGECERDHLGQGLSGEWAGSVRTLGVGWASPSRAGGAAGRGGRRRAAVPASRRPMVARRYAVSGTASSRSVRVTRPTVPTILSPWKCAV